MELNYSNVHFGPARGISIFGRVSEATASVLHLHWAVQARVKKRFGCLCSALDEKVVGRGEDEIGGNQ